MSDDEYKVRVEVDGVVYRGRRSVHQNGGRVYIDGKLVGVEVDNDGDPLVASQVDDDGDSVTVRMPLPRARVERTWWRRLLGFIRVNKDS